MDSTVDEMQASGTRVGLQSIITWTQYFFFHQLRPAGTSVGYDEKLFTSNALINEKISLWQGDITTLEVDAIVNAANRSLMGGGGVDGSIHRAAGSQLLEECKILSPCEPGDSKITEGYNLPAKHVIHTVGPRGEDPGVLASAYNSALNLMVEKNLRTIAFPCISTGAYGYPREQAAHIALLKVRHFMENNADKVDRVIFATFLPEDLKIYEELMQKYFPVQQGSNI